MKVAYGEHFDREEWKKMVSKYVRQDKTDIAGKCPICKEEVESRRGLVKEAVVKHHMFNLCKEYPWSKAYIKP